jgi:uncharacterized membrane protein YhaH (DUF805 family)
LKGRDDIVSAYAHAKGVRDPLVLFVIVLVAMLFFVEAPTGTAADVAGIVFLVVVLLAFVYNIFGLSIPRLKNAQISLWALLLFMIPGGPLWMFLADLVRIYAAADIFILPTIYDPFSIACNHNAVQRLWRNR